MRFKVNKDKYKLTTQQVKSKYLEKNQAGSPENEHLNKWSSIRKWPCEKQGYTEEEVEQLCNCLVNMDTDWLWQSIHTVQVDEVNVGTPVLYNLTINNTPVHGLFDTGASMNIISKQFYNQIQHRLKLITYNRLVSSAGGNSLQPVSKCFVQINIGKNIFRDWVIVLKI